MDEEETTAKNNGSRNLNTDEATSRRMSQIRTEDTAPEMAVRRILYGMGFRYTTENRDLPGNPDIANRSRGWVVFVHGCFWHAHQACKKGTTLPKRNREFWAEKLEKNRKRDEQVKRELVQMGVKHIVIWECQLSDVQAVAGRLKRVLQDCY